MKFIRMHIAVLIIGISQVSSVCPTELESDAYWCSSEKALFKLHDTLVTNEKQKKIVDEEMLADMNYVGEAAKRKRISKEVPWIVAETLIREGLIWRIEPPDENRRTVMITRTGNKYVSVHPQDLHPFKVAREVDPCRQFIQTPIYD